jgi:hypothetical protein
MINVWLALMMLLCLSFPTAARAQSIEERLRQARSEEDELKARQDRKREAAAGHKPPAGEETASSDDTVVDDTTNRQIDVTISSFKSAAHLTDDQAVAIRPAVVDYFAALERVGGYAYGAQGADQLEEVHGIEMKFIEKLERVLAPEQVDYFRQTFVRQDVSLIRACLRSMSTAAESFAISNSGNYPTTIEDLTGAQPPYLNEGYCNSTLAGYDISCTFTRSGYTFVAVPGDEALGSTKNISITTGGVLNDQ